MMSNEMKARILEAKKMMNYVAELGYLKEEKFFSPTEFDGYRRQWMRETNNVVASWSSLKKYADEIDLKSAEIAFEWHSDGSMLAELCGLQEGEIFYHTLYYFE